MIGRGIQVALAGHWRAPRVFVVPLGLALIGTMGRYTNPWDLLAYATADAELVLIVFPLYLFLLYRNLQHPGEALVALHLGQARRWWLSHVGAAAVTALLMAVGVAALIVVVPLVSHTWSWHWGSYIRQGFKGATLSTPAWRMPWRWGLEALGLMTVGLWSSGMLMYVLGLWWRSPLVAWLVVVMLSFFAETVEATHAQFLLWILPGVQFSMILHWINPQHPVALVWSLLYGLALLIALMGIGLAMVAKSPWDAHHGGTV